MALAAGGVGVLEVTLDSDGALAAIERLRVAPLLVGAGTVRSLAEAEAAVAAGAAFLVSPHTDPAIVDWAAQRGVPAMPGAFTPTEVAGAWDAGAAAVKLFPASVGGPALVRELRGPFADVPFVPSGGVTADNAPAFLAAGALAVGLGSWLTGPDDLAVVEERARLLTASLANV
jgi:2-dehydro-3-deoxyphosphogluconate aldolase/(4S)-4-hydroxy-2-oxoglutarate aldolase